MPAKGDARPQGQSSWVRYARLGFSGFVAVHLLGQAYRALRDDLLPEPALERGPVVVGLLLAVWLPFLVIAVPELGRSVTKRELPEAAQERALAVVEPIALLATLLFAAVHGLAWGLPLLVGTRSPEDVRPELLAALSSTVHGVPAQALAYSFAVGSASFCALRQAGRALPGASAAQQRLLVIGFVLVYLLGSYAVIRVASGSLLLP